MTDLKIIVWLCWFLLFSLGRDLNLDPRGSLKRLQMSILVNNLQMRIQGWNFFSGNKLNKFFSSNFYSKDFMNAVWNFVKIGGKNWKFWFLITFGWVIYCDSTDFIWLNNKELKVCTRFIVKVFITLQETIMEVRGSLIKPITKKNQLIRGEKVKK